MNSWKVGSNVPNYNQNILIFICKLYTIHRYVILFYKIRFGYELPIIIGQKRSKSDDNL